MKTFEVIDNIKIYIAFLAHHIDTHLYRHKDTEKMQGEGDGGGGGGGEWEKGRIWNRFL